ncbi:MAG: hypothetical protein JNM96_00345 [Bacteroidia bacterium]|nr:hypothetical protein [Bacteroidia bacterium]
MTSFIGNFYDEDSISVKTYSFNYPGYDKFYDTISKRLYFTVREKDGSGKFHKNNGFQYSLNVERDSIEWANDIRKFDITKVYDPLVFSSDVNSSVINKATGLEKFQHAGKLVYVDEKNRVGLMYSQPKAGNVSNELKGVNIDNGEVLFTAKVPKEFEWSEVYKANDSCLYISSTGLYCIHLKKGLLWFFEDVTGEKITQKLVQSIINPNAFRVKQNSYLPSDNDDVVSQICSNILVKEDAIYYSGKNNLYCIANDGSLKWKVDLSKQPTSKSALFLINEKVYLLNLGVANYKENQIVYGSPFLMKVDAKTGQIDFTNPLPMFSYPVDFQISKDLVLAGRNNLYLLTIEDGRFYNEIDVNELRYGNFMEFVSGDAYYVEKEGYYVPLNFINDNVIYFKSSHGKVYGVEGGKIQYEYHESELYSFDCSFKGYKLIKQKFNTYILNPNFELTASLNIQDPGFVVKDRLYFFSGRKLHILSRNTFKK